MVRRRLGWLSRMILTGQFEILAADFASRVYRGVFLAVFKIKLLLSPRPRSDARLVLQTKFPVAFESPDHLVPWGTANDNSSNKKFVLFMDGLVPQRNRPARRYLDLGCSGGQLVRDFLDLGWTSVGLEGSDFSQKFKRANWPTLGGRNLFTCDITKPFDLSLDEQPARFDLITAWEVLEHISTPDLENLFKKISDLLAPGGYFIASTTSAPDVHDGIELHQTKMTHAEWQQWLAARFPELRPVDLGLQYYQFVRFNYLERSFITCRKV